MRFKVFCVLSLSVIILTNVRSYVLHDSSGKLEAIKKELSDSIRDCRQDILEETASETREENKDEVGESFEQFLKKSGITAFSFEEKDGSFSSLSRNFSFECSPSRFMNLLKLMNAGELSFFLDSFSAFFDPYGIKVDAEAVCQKSAFINCKDLKSLETSLAALRKPENVRNEKVPVTELCEEEQKIEEAEEENFIPVGYVNSDRDKVYVKSTIDGSMKIMTVKEFNE